MRLLILCAAVALAGVAAFPGDTYLDYEVMQWGGVMAQDPQYTCCKANALNMCAGVADTACDDTGTCYCCPNGGGITANFTSGVQCSCGYNQTCTDTKCKGKTCGPNGYCANGACKCNWGWTGATCTTDQRCCTSPFNATEPTLCQSSNPLIAGTCVNDTCYCCPYPPQGPVNRPTFNGNQCQCSSRISKCYDPGLPPCTYVKCGLHATCASTTGVCRCDPGWTGLQPATNSCTIEVCDPPCGIHGECTNSSCHCNDGFFGETCKNFNGSSHPPPADRTIYKNATPKSVYIMYTAVIAPAVIVFMISLATLTNRAWAQSQGSSAGRSDVRSSLLPTSTSEEKAPQYVDLRDAK